MRKLTKTRLKKYILFVLAFFYILYQYLTNKSYLYENNLQLKLVENKRMNFKNLKFKCNPFKTKNENKQGDKYAYPSRLPLFMNKSLNFKCLNDLEFHYNILIWNNFYDHYMINPFDVNKCPVQNCKLTSNRSMLENSEFVFVHMPQLGNKFEKLPKFRPTFQRWIFGIYESPINSKDFSKYKNFFNLTSTYSLESDFPSFDNFYWQKNFTHQESTDFTIGKVKLAFALISNCQKIYTTSLRLDYIDELKRYIPVEVYGRCGIKCPDPENESDCRSMLYQKYKFVLSFENSICLKQFYYVIFKFIFKIK